MLEGERKDKKEGRMERKMGYQFCPLKELGSCGEDGLKQVSFETGAWLGGIFCNHSGKCRGPLGLDCVSPVPILW